MKIKPNLFIIGAPKSGTTALCEYLANHPQVLFSTPKEPKYFHTDFSLAHRFAHTESEYLRCFAGDVSKYPVVAEGTVWYLYSSAAVPNILRFNPEAQFVVMLRNPVDLAHSLHSQLLYGGDEDEPSFEAAWELQEERAGGRSLPPHCRDPKSLQYSEIARLGHQVERLLKNVSRDRVHFILFDDFRTETQAVYQSLLRFLGLEDDGRAEFPVINENRRARSRWVAKLLYRAGAVKRALGFRRSWGIWGALQPLLARSAPRPRLQEEVAARLANEFASDVRKLGQLIGRDLSCWRR